MSKGLKLLLENVIDFFYTPFKRLMPLTTFRYAACGGFNTVLGLVIYTIFFEQIFKGVILKTGPYAFEPHSAALIASFLISFPVGFILMKYIVFTASNIRGRVQFFRYFFVFVSNLALNYLLLKVLVEYLHVNAILAQVIATAVVIGTSYLLQRHFTFKVKEQQEEL
jgi:putative flippase GtrA